MRHQHHRLLSKIWLYQASKPWLKFCIQSVEELDDFESELVVVLVDSVVELLASELVDGGVLVEFAPRLSLA